MAIPAPLLTNRILQVLVGTAVGMAAADVFAPRFRNLIATMERRADLTRRLSPEAAAQAVVRGAADYATAIEDAHDLGVGHGRFDALIRSLSRPPDFETAIELWRRRALGEPGVRKTLEQSDLKDEYHEALLALRRALLSPGPIATAVAERVIPFDAGAELAALQGLERDDFAVLVESGRNPPDIVQTLNLRNRGAIDDGEAREALGRAGLREEDIGRVLGLRFQLAPASDLIRFLVREVFTPAIRERFNLDAEYPAAADAQGERIGLSPELMRNYWAAHWELPSVEQGFAMLHRHNADPKEGVDQATLELLLRTKDVMPFWRKPLTDISYHVPGRIDLRRMLQHGVIDAGEVRDGYLRLGYTPRFAGILTDFAVELAKDEDKRLAAGELIALYQERIVSHTGAQARLEALGYSAADASAKLSLADARARRAFRTTAAGVVRGRYLAREIDREAAAARLDSLGMPATGRDELLDLWTFQRDESPRRLTEAQARAALERELISELDYRAHLARLGYETPAIDVLVRLARPEALAARGRDLTRADIVRDYVEGRIERTQAAAELANLGYDGTEVERLLAAADARKAEPAAARGRDLTRADIVRDYLEGRIDRAQAGAELARLDYDATEVERLLAAADQRRADEAAPPPRRELTRADVLRLYGEGELTRVEAKAELTRLRYSDRDATILLDEVDRKRGG